MVNKVGRPSKARERMATILRAMAGVVARDGLADTTLSNVAAAAGMQRSLVLHYFGSREGLLQAFVNEVISAYGLSMMHRDPAAPLSARVDAMFEEAAYHSREDMIVWSELVALAARDATVRERVSRLWTERWLPDIERQLAEEYPSAEPRHITSAAYVLACLFEAHWAFQLQGLDDPQRRDQVREAARAILANLAAPIDGAAAASD
ncbi:TetR/AcrR family transcriptional regulator [Amycolatopsis albispora]|uniref:Transcriptional regulator n=1 Tax=Amycolatopsis albispora TaxID=1804986 RepID=A0A344LB26_9PSEU|nr:TetR family transcriptional regulator [Amycolatopsis albispora]AXB45250.1 transcriptional regulator [Amycolatopsis albispora]